MQGMSGNSMLHLRHWSLPAEETNFFVQNNLNTPGSMKIYMNPLDNYNPP